MRYFKLATHLTVPRSLLPGMGNTHVRPTPGDVIAIDEDACARHSRFVNGRMRAGDMTEIKESEYRKALEPKTEPVAPADSAAKGK
jgi:hypothetical protein